MISITSRTFWAFAVLAALPAAMGCDRGSAEPDVLSRPGLELTRVPSTPDDDPRYQGSFPVFENREAGEGRKISLNVVLLPATGPEPKPDAVFVLHGGPGAAATTLANSYARSWIRRDRDIVLVDQRGTGRSNPLHVKVFGDAPTPQDYLTTPFQPEAFRAALKRLEGVADPRFYTTPIAMDDLDDVREALGYEKVNLIGGSYGTRAALVYMRQHEEHVRTAILSGVAPPSFRNPLPHARSAQYAIERLFRAVEEDPEASEAFPDLKDKFEEILARLKKEPVELTFNRPDGEPVVVEVDDEDFLEAVRGLMYQTGSLRRLPLQIHRAWQGEYSELISAGIQRNRGLYDMLALGMLMSVVGSEDLPRITEEDIRRETEGTYLGDRRVRDQMAVAGVWPRGEVPKDYGDPVRAKVPTLLVSGEFDPVTPPNWGEEAAKHLPNSLHLIVPAAHGGFGSGVTAVERQVLERGTVEGLDLKPIAGMKLGPFG